MLTNKGVQLFQGLNSDLPKDNLATGTLGYSAVLHVPFLWSWICFVVISIFLIYFQGSQFYLYAVYNKNKPKSDSLMAEYGKYFFRVRLKVTWTKKIEIGLEINKYVKKKKIWEPN